MSGNDYIRALLNQNRIREAEVQNAYFQKLDFVFRMLARILRMRKNFLNRVGLMKFKVLGV